MNNRFFSYIAFFMLIPLFLSACGDDGIVVFDDGQQQVVFNPAVDNLPNPEAHARCLDRTVQKPTAIIMKSCYMDALSGNALSKWIIGMSYLEGNILPQNDNKAKYWLKESAKQRFIGAALMLASLYGKNANNYNDVFYALFWYTVIPEMTPHTQQDVEWINTAKQNKEKLLKNFSRPLNERELKDLDKAIKNYREEIFG